MTSDLQANVLLVDDRPENLLALESILADLGQNLVRATSGQEALRFLLVKEAALILLDVQMPGLNGFELAELIRARESTQHTPIIFISAATRDAHYVFKGYSLGAVDYLTKPFEPEILKSKVRFFTELYRQNQEIKRQAALLEQANAELDSLNGELEARVLRRTEQLETANRREKQMREQAEKASRLKDEFLATVSHELRTPLNAILGWGKMLQTGKMNEGDQLRAFETIARNAKAQAQLIDDLLDTSRLITGNLRLNLSPTPIRPVVEAALDVVRPAAEAKEINLAAVYNADGVTITCDPQRLQQMIWNLLTNAVKFTPAGGSVEIKIEQNAENVGITVSDTGQGIAPEFLPFVFDRFRQADSSSTRSHDGLGLGLAIVRHLADLHGGSVRVTSRGRGEGAVFTLTLPVTSIAIAACKETPKAESDAPQPPEHLPCELNGVRVLVIDDDADTCEMLIFALNQMGAEVQSSNSVAEGFVSLDDWQPDILLSDINMPGEDGYSLINRLRSSSPEQGANIPAIALTALARPEDSELALSSGFQLHLAKPVDIDQLASAIINLTGKSVERADH